MKAIIWNKRLWIEAQGANSCSIERNLDEIPAPSGHRQALTGWVDDFPVLIQVNDRDLPEPYLDICTVYTKPYHDKMKKVRIIVEELPNE